MKKIAVIDVGTNSVKVTAILAVLGRPEEIIFEASEITRLGEGVDAAGRLNASAMRRTAEVVTNFVSRAREQGADDLRIVGTSALRDASNREEFLISVKNETGIDLEVIDGEREASLAFAAVRADTAVASRLSGQLLVFDIGGGSTELIVGTGLVPESKLSLNIGAVRLTERAISGDPPSADNLELARHFALEQLRGFLTRGSPSMAAGIGGTAVTVASIRNQSDFAETEELNGLTVSRLDVDTILQRLIAVPLSQRKLIQGLNPKRADVIIAGTVILSTLLQVLDVPEFLVSTRGLRYGLLAEMALTAA